MTDRAHDPGSDRALVLDERLSWARREGDSVRLHLRFSGAVLPPGTTTMELHSSDGAFRPTAVVTVAEDTVVTATFPGAGLGRSAWRMGIHPPGGAAQREIGARLLAAQSSPVALLPGPAPATRMRPPAAGPRRSAARRLLDRLPGRFRRVLRHVRHPRRATAGHGRR